MPLTEAPVVGKDCKLYLNAATHATPTWTEVKSAINVSANLGKGEADVSARFSGWKLTKSSLKELEISFTYRHKRGADIRIKDRHEWHCRFLTCVTERV